MARWIVASAYETNGDDPHFLSCLTLGSIHRPLMKYDTLERIKFPLPRLLIQHIFRVLEARLPTVSYAGPTEIDILGMVFVTEPGCQQLNDMHEGRATVRSEFLYRIAVALVV